jgi:cytidine deaminase
MTTAGNPDLEAKLAGFPEGVHPILRRLPQEAGQLWVAEVDQICTEMGLVPRELALALLPLAQSFARPEISGFRVGAVALAGVASDENPEHGGIALFLGANLEFAGLPLWHTIHAEQAAVINAWCGKVRGLIALAVSSPPCGACRQFLVEVGNHGLEILLPAAEGRFRSNSLATLLPEAFGPADLDNGVGPFQRHPLGIEAAGGSLPGGQCEDPLLEAALGAAASAYAPYSGNLAGCAISLSEGRIVTGRSLESAAFNPGLTAVQAALSRASLSTARLPADIRRVALAERATTAAQAAAAELLLATWAPEATLTIHSF